MIQQSIKIHAEPVQYTDTSYDTTPWALMSENQRAIWTDQINAARSFAKDTFKVGDKFKLKTGSEVVITGFVDDDKEVIKSRGEPCVIYARAPQWQTGRSVRYSLAEIEANSHIKCEDNTNEIPQ